MRTKEALEVMRGADYGKIPELIRFCPQEVSLELYQRICLVRSFEAGVIEAIQQGFITYPVYLSTGQEAIAAALSMVIDDYHIFAQHRSHDIFLTFGGDPARLRDELLGLPSGSSKGKAGSNCLQYHGSQVTMWGHHGLIGENVPQAVGAALGSGRKTMCLFGDGAAEEDYVFASMGFAVTHRLPVFFVCVDNNLSILTPIETRRTWSLTEVARALGMPAVDVTDDPWTVMHHATELTANLPAFMNCFTCRGRWHVGAGTDGPPDWDRREIVLEELRGLGLETKLEAIEHQTQDAMTQLWDRKTLQKLLGK